MTVAVPAAIVPIPLSLVALGVSIIGLSPTNVLPVLLAALVSFSLVRGVAMVSKEKTSVEQ